MTVLRRGRRRLHDLSLSVASASSSPFAFITTTICRITFTVSNKIALFVIEIDRHPPAHSAAEQTKFSPSESDAPRRLPVLV